MAWYSSIFGLRRRVALWRDARFLPVDAEARALEDVLDKLDDRLLNDVGLDRAELERHRRRPKRRAVREWDRWQI